MCTNTGGYLVARARLVRLIESLDREERCKQDIFRVASDDHEAKYNSCAESSHRITDEIKR